MVIGRDDADIAASAMTNPIVHTLPTRAAEAIVDRVGRRIVMAIPVGIGKPNLLVNALYELALADRSITLRIITGLSLVRPSYKSDLERRFVAPLLDRLFGSWPDLAYVEAIRSGTLLPMSRCTSSFYRLVSGCPIRRCSRATQASAIRTSPPISSAKVSTCWRN